MDLNLIWFLLIAVLWTGYLILEGFDYGVGMLIPILGKKRVRDLGKADVTKMMNDILIGKTRAVRKTKNLRGKSILRGGPGAASRTVGLLGGILTYANDAGIVDRNVAHGIKKPKDRVRNRRLSTAEYREMGEVWIGMEC